MKCGIEKHAEFYRGYVIDDRSLAPLTVGLATIVALWFLVYLVGCIGAMAHPPAAERQRNGSDLAARLSLDAETRAAD